MHIGKKANRTQLNEIDSFGIQIFGFEKRIFELENGGSARFQ